MTTAVAEIDATTQAWVRNISDEKAVANGCRFDPERGSITIWWIERYCKLYEGVEGEPLALRGCHQCGDYGLPLGITFDSWEEARDAYLDRAERHAECVSLGHPIDWQYDCLMRLFGWVRWSEKWNREIRRFRKGTIFVPKKNKKSPTLAAIGHYLLSGDGEPGQKVFFAAKDGTQARKIAGEHAKQMLLRSPELLDECGINESTLRITHRPTTSWMEPLSSSNKRTQESKEGLNGCVLIDETHVVDRDFVRRLSRAGISRSEPLHLEVSTAGNNPDGYGRERFDYARSVESGAFEDQEFFVAIYAAPPDLTDADLDADPEKYGRMANPAWGHTVDPEEYLKDYATSKRSIGELLDFKMYRLNIWQRTANPWLKAGDWAKCRQPFSEGDLQGRECWAALDLSRTRDMSALVLVFPWDGPDTYRLLPYFWLPEDRAAEIEQQVPVRSWVAAGALELTPGGIIDYGYIKARFRELAKIYRIKELAYDPKFANEVTQSLEQGETDDKGRTIVEGTGIERLVFDQNDLNFAAPTKDFERFVIAGTLHHNGHPVLTWQAGHATVITRVSKVARVVKPEKNPSDPRTVDGIIAGIMGLARAMLSGGEEWYTPGCLKD